MKHTILLVGLLFFAQSYAQKFYTKTGQIDFEASVPAFEPVKASHNTVTAILNVETGEIAVLALMKGFRFRNALMEEHFNENYVESDTYPKAVFKGKIDDFSKDNMKAKQSFPVKGTLTLHGTSKEISTTLDLEMSDGAYVLQTNFSVAPGDFNIEIPGVVSDKISDEIKITTNLSLFQK